MISFARRAHLEVPNGGSLRNFTACKSGTRAFAQPLSTKWQELLVDVRKTCRCARDHNWVLQSWSEVAFWAYVEQPIPRRNLARNPTVIPQTRLSASSLNRSNGVLCPPNVDPGTRAPTPNKGTMPVMPRPGSTANQNAPRHPGNRPQIPFTMRSRDLRKASNCPAAAAGPRAKCL